MSFRDIFKTGKVVSWVIALLAFGVIVGIIYICCCRKGGYRTWRRQGPWVSVAGQEHQQVTAVPQQQPPLAYPAQAYPAQTYPGGNPPYPQATSPYYPAPTPYAHQPMQQQPVPSAPPSFQSAVLQDQPPSYQEAIMQQPVK